MSAASAGAAIRHQQFLGLPATPTDDQRSADAAASNWRRFIEQGSAMLTFGPASWLGAHQRRAANP
ncbi:MAG TPA: hypothetical protein VFV82_10215, partial [Candidatus Binatia bacterium]|nr:hypothetical protein [Candidatus Binatia bacterium]